MEIRTRALSGAGCREHQKAAAKEKRLETQRRRRSQEHKLVTDARVPEEESPIPLVPRPDFGVVDIPDDEFF